MAHFGVKPAIRTHRTSMYGSFAVLGFSSKLHSSTKPVLFPYNKDIQ